MDAGGLCWLDVRGTQLREVLIHEREKDIFELSSSDKIALACLKRVVCICSVVQSLVGEGGDTGRILNWEKASRWGESRSTDILNGNL